MAAAALLLVNRRPQKCVSPVRPQGTPAAGHEWQCVANAGRHPHSFDARTLRPFRPRREFGGVARYVYQSVISYQSVSQASLASLLFLLSSV